MPQTLEENRTATATRPRLLLFFDYACQFCYLDWPRFKRLRSEHGVELFLVPYELRPALPAEGVPREQVGHIYSERVVEHMKVMAEESRLKLQFPAFVPNTHYALALGEYARDLGPEAHEAVHEAIFDAYNADGLDIGNEEVLLEIAEKRAIARHDVAAAFHEGRFDERLQRFWHLTTSMGVSATPAALICNELFIGTRPYRVLEESVERCLVTEDKILVGSQVEAQAERATSAGSPVATPPEGA